MTSGRKGIRSLRSWESLCEYNIHDSQSFRDFSFFSFWFWLSWDSGRFACRLEDFLFADTDTLLRRFSLVQSDLIVLCSLEFVSVSLFSPRMKESPYLISSLTPALLSFFAVEQGVIMHSFFIGLTLAVDEQFTVLFCVIIFHQMFEGLGLGSRLAFLPLPRKLNYVPLLGAVFYSFVTPVGMAIGLGIRHTYQTNSVGALVTSGVLDSISAGSCLESHLFGRFPC